MGFVRQFQLRWATGPLWDHRSRSCRGVGSRQSAGLLVRLDCGVWGVCDWEYADKASLVRHANNNKVWRNLLDRFPHPYTEADADSWFALVETMSPRTHWAI